MRPMLVLLATLALAAPAAAAQTTTTIKGAPGPGPAKYDKVFVSKFGPKSAKRVLVLMPGTSAGAGDFTLVARQLVKRVPGLAVWAVDRREQALEDTSRFAMALRGTITPRQAFDFYLGWLADPSITNHYEPPDAAKFGFMRRWGLRLMLEDVRRVVLSAKRQGKQVILGGHSLGASATAAYAAWDFHGHPGYKDLIGLVLIDGGLGATPSPTAASLAGSAIAALKTSSPWLDLLGVGLPWASGAFAESGGIFALKDPNGPSEAQSFPLLPPQFKPPVQATNEGQLGYAFDESTSPAALSLIHVRAGELAPDGSWRDGEVTPIQNLAKTFGQEPANGVEWFYPRRLSIDTTAADGLSRTRAARKLGLRLTHRAKVDIPLFAVQTSLSGGRVLSRARSFARHSHIPHAVLVDASASESHLDPLTGAPDRNAFLRHVVPFLKKLKR
jgi:pimeloyl-ACP methyl ester carboxylesterase